MEEVFRQISEIKEEYACTSKDVSIESRSTASLQRSITELETLKQTVEKSTTETERQHITVKNDIEDVEVRKRIAKLQLEMLQGQRSVATQEYVAEIRKRDQLAADVSALQSPDDYRALLLAKQAQKQSLQQEVARELATHKSLLAESQSLELAKTRLEQLKPEIDKLQNTKNELLNELVMAERKLNTLVHPKTTIAQLEQQLKAAQERHAQLCAHHDMMQQSARF